MSTAGVSGRESAANPGDVTQPSSSLRSRQAQLTRNVLVDAAISVFGEIGYAAATVEDVARAAGTSRPTFYQYFRSKADVAAELLERAHRRFDVVFGQLFALTDPSRDDLRRWVLLAVATWSVDSTEDMIVRQVMSIEPAIAVIGDRTAVAGIDAIADYVRSRNSSLDDVQAHIHACHLIGQLEMLPYLRMAGIPGNADYVVSLLVDYLTGLLRG
jgi:AcrR family transcriptional regulator